MIVRTRPSRYGLRLLAATIFSLGLLFVLTSIAFARPFHAAVTDSDPKFNATLSTEPTKVTVTTAENMKQGAANSNLFVYGPDRSLISQGDATVDLNNPKQMSVNLKPGAGNGVYVVQWKTVSSDDGDPDNGAFGFTVNSTAATTNATTTENNEGVAIWVPIVAGVLALLVGLGAGFALARRSARPAVSSVGTIPTSVEEEKTTRS